MRVSVVAIKVHVPPSRTHTYLAYSGTAAENVLLVLCLKASSLGIFIENFSRRRYGLAKVRPKHDGLVRPFWLA